MRGFAPGEPVQIFLGQSRAPALTTVADQYGNFWGVGPLRVPYDASDSSCEEIVSLPIFFACVSTCR